MIEKLNFDTIIIGSGLGGLTAGATLSKNKKKVLVLEQHYLPGGCATTFKRKDYIMEVGLHEMDGLHKLDSKTRIFQLLGIFNHVKLLQVPELFRFVHGKTDTVVPHGREEFANAMLEKYPQDRDGIRKFLNLIEGVLKEIPTLPSGWRAKVLLPFFPLMYPNVTKASKHSVGSWLDKYIKNEELKIMLQGNLIYYHNDPYRMSMIYFSAAQAGYIGGGGHYVKGGSQQLSNYLASTIKENGGTVLLCKKATRIIAENNNVKGVEFVDANNQTEKPTKVYANHVIANASPILIKEMLPSNLSPKLGQKIDSYTPSCSLISLYMGFNTDLKSFGINHYSTNVFDKSIDSLKDIRGSFQESWDKRPFIFVDYSQIDACLAPKGKSVGVICSTDYLTDWDKLTETEYKRKKEEVTQILIDRLDNLYPGIKEHIEHHELGTAKTIKRFTWNPFGTPYGFEQSKSQSGFNRIQKVKGINNMFFASAWSIPGGGFTGAIISGFLAAQRVLKEKTSKLDLNPKFKDERKVKLISQREIAENTIELIFEKPATLSFKAGQYAILSIDQPKFNELDIPLRSLSMASHPSENHLRFAMRTSHSSFKKSCVAMKAGDEAFIYGPMGTFTIQDDHKPIVFLIAGMGVTPILPMLKELEIRKTEQHVHVFYSNRTEQKSAYVGELKKISTVNYHLHLIETSTEGRIDAEKLKVIDDLPSCDFYIVGTSSFLKSMTSTLRQLAVPDSHIHIDDFG